MNHKAMKSIMLNKFAAIVAMSAALLLASCGDSARFEISGRVKGAGSQTLHFVYSDGAKVYSESTTMKDGRFTFFGSSPAETIVEIQNSAHSSIGRLVIKNGENVECQLNINDPFDIVLKGNEASQLWSDFVVANSKTLRGGNRGKINSLVEAFVKKHPSSVASTAIVLTTYNSIDNEPASLKLFESIAVEARPASLADGYYSILERVADKALNAEVRPFNLPAGNGKVVHFNASLSPRSLLCFTDRESRRDTVASLIREIYKEQTDQRRRRVVEVSFDADTIMWKRSIDSDSVKWDRCWAPGAAANPSLANLSIPRLPYFIVADSAGTQLYRGTSIADARKMLEKKNYCLTYSGHEIKPVKNY